MKRYKTYASPAGGDNDISDETSTTRLFVEDLAEVKAMCVDGKTKSDVIRELVRRALYARRYRQAANDPAFREILKSVDDMTGVRLHHLEERLTRRMQADLDLMLSLVSYNYFAAFFGVEEMKQVRLRVTDESISEEEFLADWKERFAATRGHAQENVRAEMEKRRKKLAPEG